METSMLLGDPLRLKNTTMHYTWGSKHRLQALFNIEQQNNLPQAEVWMGAHPKAPSIVQLKTGNNVPLDQLMRRHSEAIIGRATSQFPFLLKLLSAEKPLSIQVHPNKKQAEEGFNRENIKGVPINALHRNYRDNNHKPELIYAVTPFKALCGFRPIHEIGYYISILIEEKINLPFFLKRFRATTDELRLIFVWMLSMTQSEKKEIIDQIITLAQKKTDDQVFQTILQLHKHYPEDSAILAPFWLNIIQLNPGEALFLDTGHLHAYLQGTGIELMVSSDNVLRGGLTSKHIDISEISQIASFSSFVPAVMVRESSSQRHLISYPVPIDDFSFSLLNVKQPWYRKKGAVHIIFCMEGDVMIQGDTDSFTLKKGDSCLLPAVCSVIIKGQGMLAIAGEGGPLKAENTFSLMNPSANIA